MKVPFINPKHNLLFLGVSVAIGICLLMMSPKKSVSKSVVKKDEAKDIGISVGGVDQQAYIARLEKNYYDFEDRVKEVESQIKYMKNAAQKIEGSQKDIAQTVLKLDQSFSSKIEEKFDELKGSWGSERRGAAQGVELSVAQIAPAKDKNWVYLPLGSFCKGTLLTGVYAAADINNPLPVIISLDEAFYGPNKTRVPLKGAVVLGKAYGDLTSERALIQIVAISTVLPDGHAFESEQDLGYVTDEWGELGVKGQVVYNTGRALALNFMGGFVAGGAQAMADSEVTTHQTLRGDVSKTVTGSGAKNALFSGVAQSAGKLAEYYQRQAEDLIPAVHIKNGSTVYFIVQKGVTINGLPALDFNVNHFMD